jgi:hypothetical protein
MVVEDGLSLVALSIDSRCIGRILPVQSMKIQSVAINRQSHDLSCTHRIYRYVATESGADDERIIDFQVSVQGLFCSTQIRRRAQLRALIRGTAAKGKKNVERAVESIRLPMGLKR